MSFSVYGTSLNIYKCDGETFGVSPSFFITFWREYDCFLLDAVIE